MNAYIGGILVFDVETQSAKVFFGVLIFGVPGYTVSTRKSKDPLNQVMVITSGTEAV